MYTFKYSILFSLFSVDVNSSIASSIMTFELKNSLYFEGKLKTDLDP